jgi:hypothetical protein
MKKYLDYIAFCPSCGNPTVAQDTTDFPSVRSQCSQCLLRWVYVFQVDKSGTFGVIGFQCDNNDRIIDEEE